MSEKSKVTLKPDWRSVRLGDVVENINDFFDRNAGTPVRYVAGEHIDEGNLEVRRCGQTSDDLVPPTFNRLFKAGDVLFHSRNIKKLARPDFDGLTGEKLFVLRTKDKTELMQDFLPFLLQGEHFGTYVQERWAGSTNKFLNKTPLMAYEFLLPPIEEQRKVVKVLSAAQENVNAYAAALAAANQVLRSGLVATFAADGFSPATSEMTVSSVRAGWSLVAAADLCIAPITKGATPSGATGPVETGIPFLKVYNLTFDGALAFEIDPTFISSDAHSKELARSKVQSGDVLMNIVGPPLGKVSIVPADFPSANINQAIARFRLHEKIPPRYFAAYLLSDWAQRWLISRSKKTSGQQNLTLELCQKLPVPVPPNGHLQSVLTSIDIMFESVRRLEIRKQLVDDTYKAILREAIGNV